MNRIQKSLAICSIALFGLFASLAGLRAQPHADKQVGCWIGRLTVPNGTTITMVFNIFHLDDGVLGGSIASPDQSSTSFPITSVRTSGDSVVITSATLRATWGGKLAASGDSIEGAWLQGNFPLPLTLHRSRLYLGTLGSDSAKLRLAFKLSEINGNEVGVLETLDQGEGEITMKDLDDSAGGIGFTLPTISSRYNGSYSNDRSRLIGKWWQDGKTQPLELEIVAELPAGRRPQDPIKPYPYIEDSVTFPNKSAKITLAGTLTIPKGKGPFPAVVLITGSGPQDRNEELMGHRPFLVLADHLTRKGIAVLRVDDRGVGSSTGNFATANTQDFASDAKAALLYLKTRKEIDPKKMGLVGHSEGGMVAPMIAAHDTTSYSDPKDVAFIVLLAGPGIPTTKLMMLQRKMISESHGVSDQEFARSERYLDAADSIIAANLATPGTTLVPMLDSLWQHAFDEQMAHDSTRIPKAKMYQLRYSQVQAMLSPWYRWFIAYDPAPILKKVTCPVLAINGSLDHQVAPKEDLEGIRSALAASHNKDFEIKELPGLNHLLQHAKTGAISEYPLIQETMNPVALETVSSWILQHVKSAKR